MRIRLCLHRFIACAALAVLAAGPAAARLVGDSPVSFRAERTVTIDGHSYTGLLFHEQGHERHEQVLLGMNEVFLLDIAQAQGYLIVPSIKTYVAFHFPSLMAELDAPDLLRHPVGTATVSGIPTTAYRIDHRARDGSRAKGALWLSAKGILMKLAVTVTRAHGGKPIPITMTLSHVEPGKQDQALFVLPPGLVALPKTALSPLLGGQLP